MLFFNQAVTFKPQSTTCTALVFCPFFRPGSNSTSSISVFVQGKNITTTSSGNKTDQEKKNTKTDFVDNTIAIIDQDSYEFGKTYNLAANEVLLFSSRGFLDVTELQIDYLPASEIRIRIYFTDQKNNRQIAGNFKSSRFE